MDRSPKAFQNWAKDYYGVPVDLEVVRQVFAARTLTEDMVTTLNPAADYTDVTADLTTTIGG